MLRPTCGFFVVPSACTSVMLVLYDPQSCICDCTKNAAWHFKESEWFLVENQFAMVQTALKCCRRTCAEITSRSSEPGEEGRKWIQFVWLPSLPFVMSKILVTFSKFKCLFQKFLVFHSKFPLFFKFPLFCQTSCEITSAGHSIMNNHYCSIPCKRHHMYLSANWEW